jgi:glycosyltransferase involved in cell wall biosynthesis
MESHRVSEPNLKFTVAICTLNRRPYVEKAVNEVLIQLRPFPEGRLLVVDNDSTDDTFVCLTRMKSTNRQLDVIREPRRGEYYARARAIEEAAGDFLIFLDDDALPLTGWLRAMLDALVSEPEVGVVGCSIEPIWEGPRPKWLSDRLLREAAVYEVDPNATLARFPSFPAGISLGIRLNECAQLYLCDERQTDYPLGRKGTLADGPNYQMVGGTDSDLCEIYARNGYQVIFISGARVAHAVPRNRLTPEYYLEKFKSEGHLRIRLSRLTGRPAVNCLSVRMLVALPLFAILKPVRWVLPSRWRLLANAYYRKCMAAWEELLWGKPLTPLPYDAKTSNGRSLLPSHLCGGTGNHRITARQDL